MSERNPNRKRELEEASTTSVPPLKKKTKLNDDSDSSSDSHDVVSTPSSSSSSAATASGECSVTSDGEENEESSSISSGCFTSESKQIAKNSSTFVVDLETHQISENETSTFIPTNFRKETSPVSEGLGETTEIESSSATENRRKPPEVSKNPTPAEIDDFFSKLENDDDGKQKKFIEKYNFDIVNDEPLQGRYEWDRLKP